jgi:hypothetical protein
VFEGIAMQLYIFRGTGRVFAFTKDSGGNNLPVRLGPWAAFKSIELVRGQSQAGVNVDECLDDIERHGIHVTDAHVRITEQVTL